MKEGYKKTEIGWIPEHWKVISISDTGAIISGGTPSTSESAFWNGKMPWCTPTDITALKGKKYISKTAKCISEEGVKNSSATIIESRSLIVCTRATLGYSAINLMPITTNQGFKSIIPNQNFDVEFLFYTINSNPSNIRRLASGSTFLEISKKAFEGIKLAFPPLPEQQKIAEILSTVDEKIEVIGEQISQTQELKRGLIQRLLTKGIGHTKFKNCPLGKIPESWEVVRIEKYIDLLSGFPFKSDRFNEEGRGTKVLRGVNITVGKLRWSDKIDRYWEEEFDEYNKYSIREGDLVISMDGSLVGRNYARVTKDALPLLLVQRVACIRAKGKLDLEYLNQIIGSSLFIDYVDAVKTSSGIPHISAKQIKEFKIALPPLHEQQKIGNILSTVDEKLEVLQIKKQQYQELKKGLMQQLLSGKIRVKLKEIELA